MFELFNSPIFRQSGYITATGWNQAKTMLNAEYLKIERYHRSNITFVQNNHFLLRLLETDIPSGDINKVAMDLSDSFDSRMSTLGIGSPFGRPDFSVNSWFYNKRTYEILLQDASLFNAEDVYENWQDARPITVLHHPFNDMSMAYPNGKHVSNAEPGYAVISINPAKLLIQFKGYIDHCVKEKKPIQSPNIWLSQYPIFNMLSSHIDIALRNRLIATFNGDGLQGFRNIYPLGINNPTSYVDAALASVIKNIGTQPLKFDRVLELIPAFSAASQRSVTPFPFNAITHSTEWIHEVARAPLLDFLVRYSKRYPNFENNDYINDIKRSLVELEMDKSIPNNAASSARKYIESLTSLTASI